MPVLLRRFAAELVPTAQLSLNPALRVKAGSFINDAEHDPSSFYAQFVELDANGRSDFATRVWEGINLPNLVDHIAPSASHADWTVTVDSTHEIESVQPAGRDSK